MPINRSGVTTTVFAAAVCLSAPAFADGMPYRGSIKDGPVAMSSPGHCYLRADVGYSWSRNPDVKWTVTDGDITSPTYGEFITDRVTDVSIDNTWFGEAGIGCGSGPRGLRGEVMLGYHGKRDISGEPGPWLVVPGKDPLHTSVSTTTLMFNGYYDLGRWDRVVPYVGVGVGFARNSTDEVYFTNNPALVNRAEGADRWSLAWALMAGVGWQLSERAVLDVGYRYLDMGKAESGICDNSGFCGNPKVRIDDLAAHEIKIGLRFGLGGGEPMMMK